MYISEIQIDGFTSYRTETTVDGLSPNVNVVVGRNGAGKSNFFAAVRFVFGDLSGRNIESMMHNGRGERASLTSVEVTLSDIGSRFPNYDEQIKFGRVLTPGNDQYFLNNKAVAKATVRALLDAAGLSLGANAFFIVPQGDVTRLAEATDEERLQTMLVASGAHTFEERKQAALRNLDVANESLEEASQLMDRMQEHLQRASDEAENLHQYLEIRKQVRGIDYVLSGVEKLRTEGVIAAENGKLESERQRLQAIEETLAGLEQRYQDALLAAAEQEDEVSALTAELQAAKREAEIARDRQRVVTNMQSGYAVDSFTLSYHPDRSLGDSMADDSEFDELDEKLSEVRNELDAQARKLEVLNARQKALQMKKGRSTQLSPAEMEQSRQEALATIEKTIAELEESLNADRKRLERTCEKHEEIRRRKADAETAFEKARGQHELALAESQDAQRELSAAESRRNLATLGMRRVGITSSRLEKTAETLCQQMTSHSRASVVRGVRQVREAVRKLGFETKYFGTVAELVDVQAAVEYAADRIAGNQYFFHVVDNAETVEAIILSLRDAAPHLAGSATFIPLEDVIVPSSPSTESGGELLKTMVSVRDARFQKVVQLIFGRHVLCPDAKTALFYARSHQVHAVSVEGDICDPVGAISGGSESASGGNGRQKQIRELAHLYDEISQCSMAEQQRVAEQAAQEVTQCVDTASKARMRLMDAGRELQITSTVMNEVSSEFGVVAQRKETREATVKHSEEQLRRAQQERESIETEFAGALTAAEEQELADLGNQFWELEHKCEKLANEEVKLSQARRLHTPNPRRATSPDEVVYDEVAGGGDLPEEETHDRAHAEVIRLTRLLEEAEVCAANRDAVTRAKEAVQETEAEMRTVSRRVEKHSITLQKLRKLVEDCERGMQSSVPTSALDAVREFEETGEFDKPAAIANKKQFEEQLKNLGPVNMRAINDFESFSKELENLTAQNEELRDERQVILDTIAELDSQKQAKLDATLKKVVRRFEEIFSVLTDGETGSLVLRRNSEGQLSSIGLDVSLGEHSGQLSGGQKCLCALAIIFAAQTSDPAPFYILDEMDANLDEGARKRAALLIRQFSHTSGTQFICTTFREELVVVADAWFGVTFNKQSRISTIEKEAALEIVTHESGVRV